VGKWATIYQRLQTQGVDVAEQLAGTTWLDPFIPHLGECSGKMLDLGCGLGADILRCAQLGYQPHGLDLEASAVDFVQSQYGFPAQQVDFGEPLPYADESFTLVLSRFALHYLRPAAARKMFAEVRRVLQPGGKLLFVVNSETHRRLGLQYDYTEAVELEPQVWHLPNDKARTFLFYTPALAKALVGEGWRWHHLEDAPFAHWDGIEKRAVVGLAENLIAAHYRA
jgi:SAM-dependent methyltransferase